MDRCTACEIERAEFVHPALRERDWRYEKKNSRTASKSRYANAQRGGGKKANIQSTHLCSPNPMSDGRINEGKPTKLPDEHGRVPAPAAHPARRDGYGGGCKDQLAVGFQRHVQNIEKMGQCGIRSMSKSAFGEKGVGKRRVKTHKRQ